MSEPRLADWYNWTPAERELWQNVGNVHPKSLCYGRPCSYHHPTDHHMRTWLPVWRNDRGILERVCEHYVGHPDPDQFQYWAETDQKWQSVHGCDGCCKPPQEDPNAQA